MKKIILAIIMVTTIIIMTGCSPRVILVPQTTYCPTFPTQDFNISKKYPFEYWIETEELNGTDNKTINFAVTEEKTLKGLLRDTKTLRNNYNTLLRNIIIFNSEIEALNKKQSEKKPQEVEDINSNWYK